MTQSSSGLRVLWATDASESARCAVPLLQRLALPSAASLTILTVVPTAMISGARPDPSLLRGLSKAAREHAVAEGRAVAQREASLLTTSVPIEIEARWGHPAEEILRAVKSSRAGLVVLGAKGHSNLGMILLGSISHAVVQHATVPVLIARPNVNGLRSILLAYDGSPPARQALHFLRSLALPAGVKLRLLHVLEPFTVPAGTPPAYRQRALQEAHEINESHHQRAQQSLDAAEASLSASGLDVETELLSGAPDLEINISARKHGDDLVVLGSRKPSPARHFLLGSTAEKLVRHSHTSVLVVR